MGFLAFACNVLGPSSNSNERKKDSRDGMFLTLYYFAFLFADLLWFYFSKSDERRERGPKRREASILVGSAKSRKQEGADASWKFNEIQKNQEKIQKNQEEIQKNQEEI